MEHPHLDIVIIKNPVNGALEQMPVAMVNAYCPFASFLHLEEAAKVAAIRDDEAATNLLLSMDNDTEYLDGKIYVGKDYPIHHEHDGSPIKFHVKATDELISGYWSFGVGFSADDGRVFDTYDIDWVIEDNELPEGAGFDRLSVEPPSLR